MDKEPNFARLHKMVDVVKRKFIMDIKSHTLLIPSMIAFHQLHVMLHSIEKSLETRKEQTK